MIIRDATEADFQRLREIHSQQNIDYPLDLKNPLLDMKILAEDAAGIVRQALLVRVTCETYLLMDKTGTPQERWGMFRTLHDATCRRGYVRGFQDANLWLPPQLEKSFGRRLMKLGWAKNHWPTYTKILEAV